VGTTISAVTRTNPYLFVLITLPLGLLTVISEKKLDKVDSDLDRFFRVYSRLHEYGEKLKQIELERLHIQQWIELCFVGKEMGELKEKCRGLKTKVDKIGAKVRGQKEGGIYVEKCKGKAQKYRCKLNETGECN